MSQVFAISGQTYHGRKGDIANAFSYGVDYLRLDPEASLAAPALFSRNCPNLMALHDRDHGGAPGAGVGAAWVRKVCEAHGIAERFAKMELIAQPRVLGHVFNPVSFWLLRDGGDTLVAVIPEVTNTYGDRHSYLCHHEDFRPITAADTLNARKIFHVSPFQPIEGDYAFSFDISPERICIRIDYNTGNGGLVATLTGDVAPLTTLGILGTCLKRPFGSRRVLGLIHWQALKLWWKGAKFRTRPTPPTEEVSR